MRKYEWKRLTCAFECTAKILVKHENKAGSAYKRRTYKAYYTKEDNDYIVHYAERRVIA